MKRGIRPVVIGGALLLAALLLAGGKLNRASERLAPAGEAAGEGRLQASGTIRTEEVEVAAPLGGTIATMAVGPGDEVEAGQVVVRLDESQLQTRLAEAEAAVAAAEADLAVLRAGPRGMAIQAAQAEVMRARAAADGAEQAWRDAQAQVDNPQALAAQISDARTQVSLAEQAVELAEAQLAAEQLLREQTDKGSLQREMADYQVRAREEALAKATADQEAAQTLLNWLYTIHKRPLALMAQATAARGEYEVAAAGVAVAEAQLADLRAGPAAEALAVAQAQVELAQAEAAVLRTQLAKLTLRSPRAGVVLRRAYSAGEVVAPAVPILTIADLSELTLVVYVPADQIGGVQQGQAVAVTVDSFPGRTFAGEVRRIGDEPEYTPRNVATVEERVNTFFEVRIRVPNEEGLLKAGMPGDVVFEG